MQHFQIHADSHLEPAKFDPDPEQRELAALGVNQRHYARLSEFGKNWWQWHHDEAAARFHDSPKWQTLGRAMAADNPRIWNYPDLDRTLVSVWPLLKLHNWTYRDLLAVARRMLPAPHRYPLTGEPELATYCQNVLGVRKAGPKGRSASDGKPRGWEVMESLRQMAADSS